MKIIIIQEAGRHLQNKHFREALSYKRAFLGIGVEAKIWGLGYDNFSTPFEEISKNYDTILLLENYDTGWVPDLSKYKNHLKAQISIDSHCNLGHLVGVCERHGIQVHLGATKSYLHHFQKPGRLCHWLPNCYDDTLIYPMPEVDKNIPVGFCGNYATPERKNWVRSLVRDIGLKADVFQDDDGVHYEHIGEGMVRNLNSYKIVVNRSISDDLNYRLMESLGTKSFLLTNNVPNLSDLFDIGKHLITYDSYQDLIEKVLYYSEHEEERLAIAEAGYQHVKETHTFVDRSQEILDVIKEFTK